MTQNRNKLIDLFIGNLSNSIVHKILEASSEGDLKKYYTKEFENSFALSIRYREQINPKETFFPDKDQKEIKERLIKRINSRILERIKLGYKNIELEKSEELVDNFLRKLKVKESIKTIDK